MDQMNVVKRAWKILWSYRALWIFGILIALTSSNGSGGGGGSNSGWRFDQNDTRNWGNWGDFGRWMEQFSRQAERLFTPERLGTLVGIGIALICAAFILGIVFAVLRYVSQAAQIRMVDQYEVTGEKLSFRQGWRLGWSRAAWRLFLINLVIFLPVVVAALLLLGTAMLPMLGAIIQGTDPGPGAVIASIGLVLIMVLIMILVGVAISLFSEIIYRVCVLQDRGPIDSIRTGLSLIRRHFKDVFLMWLLLVGISVALIVVFIPVTILLVVLGLGVGGGLGAGLFFLLRALADATAGAVTGGVVGVTLFLLVIALPLLFLGGLRETFFSSSWTLAYRELDHMEKAVLSAPAPQPEPVGAGS